MNFAALVARANAVAGRGFIAATQFATTRGLVRRPSHDRDVVGQGAFRYRVVRDGVRFEGPTGTSVRPVIENAHEMAFDRDGRLYLLTDHAANNVLVFAPDGSLERTFTFGMDGAHGLTLAREGGREVLFVTDAYGPRVLKATLTGEVLLDFPAPASVGAYGAFRPYLPTQTAVAPNGDVYVADGYGSDFVLRFDAAGHYLGRFGGHVRGPSSLRYAHGIAVDARAGAGRETLLVSSRVEQCLKRFDLEGNYLATLPLPGGFPCRPVIHGEHVYVALCWSGVHLAPNSGFVVVLGPDDRIVATLGGHVSARGRLVSDYSTFTHVHDVAVAPNGDLFACEWNAGGVVPVRLERLP